MVDSMTHKLKLTAFFVNIDFADCLNPQINKLIKK